jgi:ribosomal protein S18 acetylase RimI-like enzyme
VLELREVPAGQLSARTADTVARVAQRGVTYRYRDADVARAQSEQLAAKDTSAFLDVVESGSVVGTVWLGSDGDELGLYELTLDDTAWAAELVPLLEAIGHERGARMIGVGVYPGQLAHQALAALPGFTLRATNMALDLDGELGDPGSLVLEAMTQPEFDAFMSDEVEGFAQELAAAGTELETARERSRAMMGELVPSGMSSPGMEFHAARVDGETVGALWLSTGETMAFVYNIEVRPEHRRRGYGAAIMNAAAIHCREAGHPVLGLNVFAHNPGARALYDKLGYRVTHDFSALDLSGAG